MLLVDLGNAYGGFQDYATALGYHERGLEYVVQLKTPQLEGALLVNLSYGLQRVGRSADGLVRAQQALALATTHNQPGVESAAHLMIGSLAGETGDFTLQSEAFERAAQPLRDKGRPAHLAHRLRFIAESLRECGRHLEALEMLQECVQLLQQGSPDHTDGVLAETLSDLGAVNHALGRYDDALAHLSLGLGLAIEHDIFDQEILIRTRIGDSHAAAGRPDDARTEWQLALAVSEKHGAPTDQLRTLLED
jgi:tetratricopeptide (TPR) repeat protein